MDRHDADALLGGLMEQLASIEHERWSHWQRYLHSKGRRQPDGSLLIPAEFVQKWEKQLATKYAQLAETEKDSDREQVRKYLSLIAEALSKHKSQNQSPDFSSD